ncbi:cytochrome P450 [Sedimentimonas flavescens]|uniref:cytochrome P450 n=1 Tax=Sedimentimonas flavescens TaxID=2851012 RepID=UPI0021A4CB49|nr:cytochrome P450 [Sedimentimonas flavescens]MCT2541240.1 cytochrome P450 [Sedimentimonas flavescens]
MMQDADTTDTLPFLDLANPAFSIRSQAVLDARDASWCARTPYGLAALRYDDVQKLLRHPKLRQGSYRWPAHNGVTGTFARWWEAMLLSQEGATHARLRRMANPAFSPKLIGSLIPKFQALANQLIDNFAEKGECDFIADFTEPYATGVICDLLGLPFECWRELADIAADMGLALGVTFKRDLPTIEAATKRIFTFAEGLVETRRAAPTKDFIGTLIKANEDKALLSDQELLDMIVLAIFGGIDTTRNQIGLAMATFIENPEQWKLLGEQPELARAAVEEVMRVRPTVTWVTREAVEDFTYNDTPIAKGTTVHLFSQSATSDPEIFPNPGFDITAERKPHFGFGGGTHHCLGHFIARGDMTEALKLLAQRLKNPRFNGEVEWLPDSGNTGAIKMPIAFDAA